MKKTLIIIGIIVAVLLIMGVSLNNNLVEADENVSASWANVENVLQRRYDLIPNLVNTVRGYAEHEKSLFTEITELRSKWADASGKDEQIAVASGLENALSRLMVVVENYPDLKANQNFLALQDELAGTENRISVERRRYNESVQSYNKLVRRFPSSIVAGLRGFSVSDDYFKADSAAQKAPEVSF
ncbi:MAG: LemA family protein [Lentisphaerae bacterium]|nr:LemA family protein [Lentisphaerota bacterium]